MNKRLSATLTIMAMAILWAAPAMADYPADCNGLNDPSGADCMGLSYEGCCDDQGRVTWCDDGQLFCIDCAAASPECGWQGEFYDCNTDGSAGPPEFPKDCVQCNPPCGPNEKCQGGQCVACNPDCGGKQCGSDGCGGTCGSCSGGKECVQGACVSTESCQGLCGQGTPAPAGCYCDDQCFGFGDCCPNVCLECPEFAAQEDCQGVQPQCGDGLCSGPGENCATCQQDCPCGAGESCNNGVCEAGCIPFCDGMQCGPDGCGGACGQCPTDFVCENGACVPGQCEPDCTGKACGDDGCGGSCGACTDGAECINGKCIGCQPNCGGKQCGDDGCGGSCGECPAGKECDMHGNCVGGCDPVANCQGKVCGDDGCGGQCGQCNPGEMCDNGACVPECIANCVGKVCGDDGCGGQCGQCAAGQQCDALGQCQAACIPNCVGKQCGDDGCGAVCGTCGAGEMCTNGACVPQCAPQCLNKECGADGCGGFCGVCTGNASCSDAGVCVGGEGNVPGADVTGDGGGSGGGGGAGGGGGGGGGGCSSAGSGAAPAGLLLLGLFLAVAAFGRRFSTMRF